MPNVSSPLEMTDEQIGRLYETIGAANDLLGKGVAPSLSCHTDVVRAAITLMHLYDAVRGERAGDERREPNPDSTADETLVLECVRRYGNNPVGEAAMRICCDRVRDRLAQYRAALATLTRERDEARTVTDVNSDDTALVDRLVDSARNDGIETHCNANTKETGDAFVRDYSNLLSRLGFLRGAAEGVISDEMVKRAAREMIAFDHWEWERSGEYARRHYTEMARRALTAALSSAAAREGR